MVTAALIAVNIVILFLALSCLLVKHKMFVYLVLGIQVLIFGIVIGLREITVGLDTLDLKQV